MNKLEQWEERFRRYFDKCLKPRKPSMGNLDREICVDFIRSLLLSERAKILDEVVGKVKGIQDEYRNDEPAFNNGLQAMKGDVLNALAEVKSIIEKMR